MRTQVLLALTMTTAMAAQQPNTPAQTLRAVVDLVRVDVTVVDAKGQPVAGLGVEDFAVVERGRPLSIATVIPVGARADDTGATDGRAAPPTASMKNLYVVILDDLMLRSEGGALFRTKRVFREFVARLAAGDEVAVLATSGAPRHTVPFTSDKARLLRAVDGLMPMSAQPLPLLDSTEPLSGSLEPSELWKTRTSAAVLKHAIRELRTIVDARKAVVLISEGLPYELLDRGGIGSEIRLELTEMIETGRDADVPVFAFDPGTVTAPPGFAQQNLRLVSEATGGRLTLSTSDLRTSLDAMLAAQQSYYIVAFHPADTARGSTHTFTLKVNRPGATVRSRREYVVTAPGK